MLILDDYRSYLTTEFDYIYTEIILFQSIYYLILRISYGLLMLAILRFKGDIIDNLLSSG